MQLREFFQDRIQVNSLLIVLCFVSVLLLESQSAASYPTYLLALSMLFAVRQWNDVFRNRMLWLIAALLGLLWCSSFWSRPFAAGDAASVLGRGLLVFFFVVAFAECQLRGQLRRWLGRALATVGLVAVLAAIANFYLTNPEDGRLNGLGQLDTHVVAALVYGVVLIFVLDVALTDSGHWRWLALLCCIAIALAIYLSDSRNAWASAVIGVGVFLTARRVRDPQRFVAGVAALGVVFAVLLAALLVNDATREWVLPRGDSFRPVIWQDAMAEIQRGGLWFGLGINTSNDVTAGGVTFLHPHNMYLSVAYQGGLVALTLFIALIAGVVVTLLRHYEQMDAKLALGILGLSLPAYLLDGHELIDKVGATWFLFWLPVAVALGINWRWLPRGL